MENSSYKTLEELESLLSESGYICLGHGIGRSDESNEIVESIFKEGLRAKDNSLYFTTIGLSTPTPEIIKEHEDFELSIPTIKSLKNQLNNWQHLNSKKIIIARLPMEYINMLGDRSDLDGEMYGAFMNEKVDELGHITSYLDPRFIIGCFDVNTQRVILNNKFEKVLSSDTINKLKSDYKKTLEKTRDRLNRFNNMFNATNEKINDSSFDSPITKYDSYDSFDFPDIDWDDTSFFSK